MGVSSGVLETGVLESHTENESVSYRDSRNVTHNVII